MCEVLASGLAKNFELHIFSDCDRKTAELWNARRSGILHPVSGPEFWWSVGRQAAAIRPDVNLVISGLHKTWALFPVIAPLLRQLSQCGSTILLQSVNLSDSPGPLANYTLRIADHLLASNPSLAVQLQDSTEIQVGYLPPCIDTQRIAQTAPAVKNRPLRVGFINHINRVKGADLALAAFALIKRPDTEFFVAGEGDLKAELQQRYAENPGICFEGRLEDPIAEIKSCDIMVLPFRTSVSVLGVSQTVLECMAAGVVVIGSDETTITSVIEHDKTGIIVSEPGEIQHQIERLLDNPALRQELAKNAAAAVSAHDADFVTGQLTEIIG